MWDVFRIVLSLMEKKSTMQRLRYPVCKPEYRKKRPAKSIAEKSFEEYEGRIAITEFTKEAEALYNIMGVFEYVFPKKANATTSEPMPLK